MTTTANRDEVTAVMWASWAPGFYHAMRRSHDGGEYAKCGAHVDSISRSGIPPQNSTPCPKCTGSRI